MTGKFISKGPVLCWKVKAACFINWIPNVLGKHPGAFFSGQTNCQPTERNIPEELVITKLLCGGSLISQVTVYSSQTNATRNVTVRI